MLKPSINKNLEGLVLRLIYWGKQHFYSARKALGICLFLYTRFIAMTPIGLQLQKELKDLSAAAYRTDRQLNDLLHLVTNAKIKEYTRESARFFKQLGDHLFLALAAFGLKMDLGATDQEKISGFCVDEAALKLATTDLESLAVLHECYENAFLNIKSISKRNSLPEDISLILEKGIEGLNCLLNKSKSLLDK